MTEPVQVLVKVVDGVGTSMKIVSVPPEAAGTVSVVVSEPVHVLVITVVGVGTSIKIVSVPPDPPGMV